MAGISSQALSFGQSENKFGYNGNKLENQEFSDGSGLEAYDFNARMYNAQIGRFFQIDLMSEYMRRWSSYAFSFDNPILYSDPTGKAPGDTNQLPDVVVTTSVKHKSNAVASLGAVVLLASARNAVTWEITAADPEPFTKALLTLFAIASTAYAIHEIQQELKADEHQNDADDAVNKPPSVEEEQKERSEQQVNDNKTEKENANDVKPNDNYKKIKGNDAANQIAQEHGYEDAHDLKEAYVGKKNVAKFDIYKDSKTGKLQLQSKDGTKKIDVD